MQLSEVKNGLVRIAVAYTGRYERDGKEFSISADDLAGIRRNLSQREAPIDYEHLSAAAGAPPAWAKAAGWLRRPDKIEDFGGGRKILWAWAELTPAMAAMVKQKEYRYFSPEIHWNDVDEHGEKIGTRLAAGAMTNRPFLKDLPPIELSDEDYRGLFGLGSGAGAAVGAKGLAPLPMVALSDGTKLMDLDSVHVPAASKSISVAYHQPSALTPDPSPGGRGVSGARGERASKEKTMTRKFSFRKLTDGPHEGKFGLYKHDELMMDEGEPMVFEDDDFPYAATNDGNPAAAVNRPLAATEARLLAEMFREGRVDPTRASTLAADGRIALAAVFRAQAAERLVDHFIAEGKLLPKRRAAAFRLALEDEAGLRALLSDARPMVDFAPRGLAAGVPQSGTGSAQAELDEMVRQWIAEHNTDYSAALSEVTKRNPELWQRASAEVSERARVGEEEQE